MPGKLIITRGLSGSGKTTWAKDFCSLDAAWRVRVNRDDLRSMLFGGYVHGHAFEQMVTRIQQESIRGLLQAGKTVIVDDTNLALRHARQFSKLAFEEGAEFDVFDHFLHVPLDECIARDAARPVEKRVGEQVIRTQYERFGVKRGLPPVPPYVPAAGEVVEPYVPVEGTPAAVIVDIDGTIALMGDRGPYDWKHVGEDKVNTPVRDVVHLLQWAGFKVIFLSGRDESCRAETLQWLADEAHVVSDPDSFDTSDRLDDLVELFMRPEGDNRKDSIIKLELFDEHVRNHYDVKFVLDDRDQVVELWRSLGLACFQVNYGAF